MQSLSGILGAIDNVGMDEALMRFMTCICLTIYAAEASRAKSTGGNIDVEGMGKTINAYCNCLRAMMREGIFLCSAANSNH